MARAAALFDMDRTLLDVNSANLWVRREWRDRRLGPWQVARAGFWLGLYHLGFTDMERLLRDAIATLSGQEEAELEARTAAFYEQEVRHRIRPGARQAIAAHRAAGDRLVLLTSASIYIARLVADDLGLDDVLCNRFEVDDSGRFTGRPVEPLCFGPGKVEHARRWAEAHGVDLSASTAYADSMTDLAILEAVGHPVAVHPDPRLRRVAVERGWPVADWGER